MALDECPICKEMFILAGAAEKHVCPPAWEIWNFEDEKFWGEDGPTVVYAHSDWDAAEKYADRLNYENEYFMIESNEGVKIKIRQRDKPDAEAKILIVTAEPSVDYYVREVDSA